MTLISFNDIGQSWGDFDLFIGLSGSVQPDSKIGLVGANGTGKTTLLKIMVGEEEPSKGNIDRAKTRTVGYLKQEAVLAFADTERTLYAEMMALFDDLHAMEARMREIETMMTEGTADTPEYDEYGTLQEEFEHRGGYDYERRIEVTLLGLGFSRDLWDTPIKHLSGGQKTRALLARLIIMKPDLLVLDEPTNHLDVNAMAWLEGTLKVWDRALLIVSHDRYFLDNVVNTIWEMTNTGLETYKGNYTAYVRLRQERQDRINKEWESVMERFWNEYEFIEKRGGLEDTNAAGRFKVLTREVESTRVAGFEALALIKKLGWGAFSSNYDLKRPPQTMGELRKAIKSLERPIKKRRDMRVNLQAKERSGEMVMTMRHLSVGYPERPLFQMEDVELERGEVIALIGGNGTGKSTLLKTIMGYLKPLGGRINTGHNVKIGYFAQAHDNLNHDNQVIEELMRHKDGLTIPDARHHLAQYLFRGDDVFKQVSKLSGGERGRLALSILAMTGANFLILDEPTNHLDIPSQEILQEVLEDFEGTILLVSHDRYLVDRLANQIWDLQDGELSVYKMDYQAYLAKVEAEKASGKTPKVKPTRAPKADKTAQELETQIGALERSLKELSTIISAASTAGNTADVEKLGKEYMTQQDKLNALNEQWDKIAEKVVSQ
jgi:ATP-binding cassette subfamily F protein 3